MLRSMARGVKDGALALSLKALVNDRFRDYGEVVDCSISTADNRLTVRALLKGEREPVTATVERYEIESEGEDRYIKLQQFTSSRAWLTLLLNKLFGGKRYKLPPTVARLL
ncbi:MAG: hypothetical protein NVS9B10_08080 [Nevskia sp.]